MAFRIRPVQSADAAAWLRLRRVLWPGPDEDHAADIRRFFAGERLEPAEVLMAFDEDGNAVGFAELSIRSIVDGCAPGRVGYLEGWFVAKFVRNNGVGAMLVRAAEEWALQQGCSEFGSDTELENEVSIAAHKALGFEETGRVVEFRKSLLREAGPERQVPGDGMR
jgi:aminoglycoside 6'-N-acetyltransferase I